MERMRMPRINRATQFAPFDAMKGLQEALRLAEYNHERIVKGEVSEEQAEKISSALNMVEKNSMVKILYFEDGHNHEYNGKIKLDIENQLLELGKKKLSLSNLLDIEIID